MGTYLTLPDQEAQTPAATAQIYNILEKIAGEITGNADCLAILDEEGTLSNAASGAEHCPGLGSYIPQAQPALVYKLSAAFTDAQAKSLEDVGCKISTSQPEGYYKLQSFKP